jgi:NADH-quinone oxidoreductase subunit J
VDLTTEVFWIFSVWAIGSALICITRRNTIASVMWLVSAMFALSGLFVLLHAQFIAAIQVLVYAGAVMVLFLFVVMLLNLGETPAGWRRWYLWLLGAGVSVTLLVQLAALGDYTPERLANEFSNMPAPDPALVFAEGQAARQAVEARGVVGAVAQPLFEAYLVPFEITSVLLLVAVIGAVVLAKRRL